uniref:AIRS_C domain-containing protein n=1 Tax=Macrostomum lignano TaxID=282301 RepID=A0A1I8FEL2_9PLAT
ATKYPHLMALVSSTLAESASNSVLAMCEQTAAHPRLRVPVLCPLRHVILTAETHNFPTAVAPFEGAATGAGGRIRDVHGDWVGADPQFWASLELQTWLQVHHRAGTAGYCVGDLDERFAVEGYAAGMARPRRVLLEASDGASDYGNKFGEPTDCPASAAHSATSFKAASVGNAVKAGHVQRRVSAPLTTDWLLSDGQARPISGSQAGRAGLSDRRRWRRRQLSRRPRRRRGGADELNFNAVQRGDAQMGGKLYAVGRLRGQAANVLKRDLRSRLAADMLRDKFQLGDPTSERSRNSGPPSIKSLTLPRADLRAENGVLLPSMLELYADTGVVTLYSFAAAATAFVSDGGRWSKAGQSLVAQQQCVGPLHTPSSRRGRCRSELFRPRRRRATAIGEQPIKGLLDPSRAGRMAVCEALTNLAMARVTSLADVNAARRWRPAGCYGLGYGGDFMKQLGVAIDGGKDSLSMAASVTNQTTGETQSRTACSLGLCRVCPDITLTLQPVLQPHAGPLIHVPLGDLPDAFAAWAARLSPLRRRRQLFGRDCPNPDADRLAAGFRRLSNCCCRDFAEAADCGHDISDGGLAVAAIEMALAAGGRCGLELRVPDYQSGVLDRLNSADYRLERIVGLATVAGELRIVAGDRVLLDKVSLADLREAWERPSHQLELAQCQPDCASTLPRPTEPCLLPSVDRLLAMERRFTVAIIREEGSNGDREMAAPSTPLAFESWTSPLATWLLPTADGEDGVSLADCRGRGVCWRIQLCRRAGLRQGLGSSAFIANWTPSVAVATVSAWACATAASSWLASAGLTATPDSGSSDSSAPRPFRVSLSDCPSFANFLSVASRHVGQPAGRVERPRRGRRFSVASADSLLAGWPGCPLVYVVDQAGEATSRIRAIRTARLKAWRPSAALAAVTWRMMPHPGAQLPHLAVSGWTASVY